MLAHLLEQTQEDEPVLAIGAASVDIVGRLREGLQDGASTPANVATSYGGGARNFAENLARLGQPVALLSAVGKDQTGRQLLKYTEKAGVDVSKVMQVKEHATSSYLAVVNEHGELQFALDDMQAMTTLTPEYIEANAGLFDEAALIYLDANVPTDTLARVMEMAAEANLPVAADPTTVSLTPRFQPYLNQITLMTPNHREAGVLCDQEIVADSAEQALEGAKHLVSQGVDLAIVTLAEFGLSYATSEISGHVPAIRTQIVDPTGGGDALTAAVVFALLNGIQPDEAVRLGISAASLTLRHRGAALQDLSLELLYDQLI